MPKTKPLMKTWNVQWEKNSVQVQAPSKFAAKKLARLKYKIHPNTCLEITEGGNANANA